MRHWQRIYPEGIYTIVYEELVANPELEIQQLLEHCQLLLEPACLTPHLTQRAVRTASATQVKQPIYHSSVRKWHHYQKHLAPLQAALGLPTQAEPTVAHPTAL